MMNAPNKNPHKAYIDKLSERANAAMPELLKAHLDAGVPIVYVDAQERLVKEMPSGEIIVLPEKVE